MNANPGWIERLLPARLLAAGASVRPGWFLAPWAALAVAGTVLVGLGGLDLVAAGLLLAAPFVVALAGAAVDRGPDGPWSGAVFLRRAGEVGLAALLLFVAGWRGDADPTALWPAWLAAVALASQAYDRIVTAAGGVRVGPEPRGLGWLRLAPADVPAWIGAWLLLGRPVGLLWGMAGLAWAGFGIAAARHVAALRALDRAEGAGPGQVPGPEVPRWKTLAASIGRSGDQSFWGIWGGQSVSFLCHAMVFRARWATPNRITAAAFVVGLASAGLAVVDSLPAVIAAVVLMQLRNGLDALDGQMARLRGASSRFGSWFDKLSDLVIWASLFGATAYCAGRQEGHALAVLIPLAGSVALAFQGVTFWLDKRSGVMGNFAPPPQMPFWRKLLVVLPRFPFFEEPDYYFWMSLALLIGDFRWLVAFTGIAFGLRVTGATVLRTVRAFRHPARVGA